MQVTDLKVTFDGMESSDSLRNYLYEKLEKHEGLFKIATGGSVVLREEVARRGVDEDFSVRIRIDVPKSVVYVKERGSDMYAIIDSITDTLVRKMKRYLDKLPKWEGKKKWKTMEVMSEPEDDSLMDVSATVVSYPSSTVKHLEVEDWRPMYVEEAIEKMELLGFRQLLFKNTETGKCAMLYRKDDNSYVLVEPKQV